MLISAVQESDSIIHIYTFFFIFFSIIVITGYWIEFPVLYSRTLSFILSIYNSLHLLIPNSQSVPPPPFFPLGNHKSVLYVCESVSVSLSLFFLIWLCWVLVAAGGPLSCGMRTISCSTHAGSSSPTRDRTWAPCIGSAESYPLDHQGSLPTCFDWSENLLHKAFISIISNSKQHDLCVLGLVCTNGSLFRAHHFNCHQICLRYTTFCGQKT